MAAQTTDFKDMDPGVYLRLLTRHAAQLLDARLRDSVPGACLRVSTLPRPVMQTLAHDLHTHHPAAYVRLLIGENERPREPWEAKATQLVALRNAEDRPLLIFVPPGLHTSAEDSFDVSTFAEVGFSDLAARVGDELTQDLPDDLRDKVTAFLEQVGRKMQVSDDQVVRYLLTFRENGLTKGAEGLALYQLGLIPDRFVFSEVDYEAMEKRLKRNLQAVQTLSDAGATLLTRVYRLKLEQDAGPDSVQTRLYQFLSRYTPEDVMTWGAAMVTQPAYRDLTLDQWPFIQAQPDCWVYVQDLKLPVRRDIEGAIKYLNPKQTPKLAVAWDTTPDFKQIAQLDHFRIEIVNSSGGVMYESGRIGVRKSASRRMSSPLTDIGDIGLPEDVYFIRVRAYSAEGGVLNREDREDRSVLRDPADPDSKRINESEEFLYTEEVNDVEGVGNADVRNQTAASYLEARLAAQWKALDEPEGGKHVRRMRPEKAAWLSPPGLSRLETEVFNIRYTAQSSFSLTLSGLLVALERQTLAGDDTLGRWRLDFADEGDLWTVRPEPRTTAREAAEAPPEFLAARRRVFELIARQSEMEPEEGGGQSEAGGRMITATVDLLPLASQIEDYLAAYCAWLEALEQRGGGALAPERTGLKGQMQVALDLDTVEVRLPRNLESRVEARLLAPTHPLRLWWHLQWQRTADEWLAYALEQGRPKEVLSETGRGFLRGLLPRHLPPLLSDGVRFYIDSGPLTPFWQLYLPSELRDSRAARAQVESRLNLRAGRAGERQLSGEQLAAKIRQYLVQHPYVVTLKLNVFNPGDARLIAEALVELQAKYRPDLHYEVHLFGEEIGLDEIGGALLDLQNPTRQVSDAQDEFAQASGNHLFPKLRFARHHLSELRERPGRFTAHISLLLNVFPVDVTRYPPLEAGRSNYIEGLIQEPVTCFTGGAREFVWHSQYVARWPTGGDGGRQWGLGAAQARMARLQAHLTWGGEGAGLPTVRLGLDLDAMGLLYQIHAVSDWVLTVDNNLGLEYFDTAPQADVPVYLLDFSPEYLTQGGERMALTTRAVDEILGIVGPALERYGIREGEGQELLFLHLLRSLSGHLALKLLAAPTHADEALSLALTRLFLEQAALLGDHIAIPLDAHTDLFASTARVYPELGPSRRRSDLLMVEADPEARVLVFHLLEVKSRRYGVSPGLEVGVEDQLANTERVLRARFDPDQPPLDREIRAKELGGWIGFYLERARRYGLMSEAVAAPLRAFLTTLDQGYKLQFVRTGLVFDLTTEGLRTSGDQAETLFYYIGTNHIRRLVQQGLRTLAAATAPPLGADGKPMESAPPAVIPVDPAYQGVREHLTTTLYGARCPVVYSQVGEAGPRPAQVAAPPAPSPLTPAAIAPPVTPPPSEVAVPRASVAAPVAPPPQPPAPLGTADLAATAQRGTVARADSQAAPPPPPPAPVPVQASPGETRPHLDIWLGDTRPTSQYGVLGVGSGKIVGLDLNGVNTISLFGVQGSGKSYTMGTIIEMATQPFPGLNHLPHPLATVVFHYHESQDYPPEFVSMAQPNTREEEVRSLAEEYGAAPAPLADIVVLTSADKLAARRAEFGGLAVQSIHFRSSELGVRDWMFLMGAIGNQSMYINQIAKIMRECRDNLTLDAIRDSVRASRLTDAQKELAELRLDFAAEYIDDTAPPLAESLKPGRLLIVDLRDELIQRDQALGLFVVLLNIFAGVGSQASERFNKLIVFDEAHKYMTGGELTDEVVTVIRQMRHQGVSVLIASQDPASLPGTVIELSHLVVLHRFNSPSWLKHIQKSIIALSDLSGAQLAALRPGEAYVWANRATEAIYSQKPMRIRLRPRATLHGGATKTAG